MRYLMHTAGQEGITLEIKAFPPYMENVMSMLSVTRVNFNHTLFFCKCAVCRGSMILAGTHLTEIGCNHRLKYFQDFATLSMRQLVLFPHMISPSLDNEIPYAYSWSRRDNFRK